MQLLVLILAFGIFIHDESIVAYHFEPFLHGWQLWVWLFVPRALLALAYHWICKRTCLNLGQHSTAAQMKRLNHFTSLHRFSIVTFYVADLAGGLLVQIRNHLGDWILLDEILVMLPTLIYLLIGWWSFYPIDKKIREASMMRDLDAGKPVYPIWTRGQFIVSQVRHQLALLGLPILLLLGWTEILATFGKRFLHDQFATAQPWLLLAGAGVVFLFSPIMIRYVWDTLPLPHGTLRDKLLAMCKSYRVGVNELLLWQTHGGLINAAVMGFIKPLRFILLSDALLDTMSDEQIEAVMAHEIAHIHKHHMFWLLIIASSMLGIFQVLFAFLLVGIVNSLAIEQTNSLIILAIQNLENPMILGLTTTSLAFGCWFLSFGWVSRRMERQADAFAVAHFAATHDDADREQCIITYQDAAIMADALGRVAKLNNTPTHKRSWRHGSIAWRQNYLQTLIGQSTRQIPIDHVMNKIKLVGVLLFVIAIALQYLSPEILLN